MHICMHKHPGNTDQMLFSVLRRWVLSVGSKLLKEGCDVISEVGPVCSFRRKVEGLPSGRLLQQSGPGGMQSWVIPSWLSAAETVRVGRSLAILQRQEKELLVMRLTFGLK